MHHQRKTTSIIAWILCAATCLAAMSAFGSLLIQQSPPEDTVKLIGDAAWTLLPISFAITAALIVSRQPGNVIGWLLMSPASLAIIELPIEAYMNGVKTPPPNPSPLFLLFVWFTNWSWLLLIIPLILIPLLFPTGRPPSPRWYWVLLLAALVCVSFLYSATFSKALPSPNGDWSVPNPIGSLGDATGQPIDILWKIGMVGTILLCAASLFVRYRHAGVEVRKQIKWLLFAILLFSIVYISGIRGDTSSSTPLVDNLFSLLFNLTLFTFPISIAIAILNYRLWDIDILIQRTLIYTVLTATLAIIYFGSILALQQVFHLITGNSSPIAIVISTLAIAALFAPMRKRVQDFIDRRFYRQKYNATRALEEFQIVARREVELERLTGQLVGVVDQTVHPDGVWIWIRK